MYLARGGEDIAEFGDQRIPLGFGGSPRQRDHLSYRDFHAQGSLLRKRRPPACDDDRGFCHVVRVDSSLGTDLLQLSKREASTI